MLAMGLSKPWQDALFEITGQRQMDATAILRLLRAAPEVAGRAEQGQAGRLVGVRFTGARLHNYAIMYT